jgi:hypothetical protein
VEIQTLRLNERPVEVEMGLAFRFTVVQNDLPNTASRGDRERESDCPKCTFRRLHTVVFNP